MALRLAEAVDGEVINADALQVYADLRVLTARPTAADEARAPHRLFGVADARDGWSVGRWLEAAADVLKEIAARGRSAIVVGGTGLYFHALTKGLAAIPPVPAEVRSQATADLEAMGEAGFRERLARHDPAAAARIEAGDRQRLIRAWAVYAASGTALSDWQGSGVPLLAAGDWTGVALDPPRDALYARCDARLNQMVAMGALEEVAALAARNLDPALPALKALGYRELAAHLRGEASLEDAVAAAAMQTRRYAKRQTTWTRGQMADWPRLAEIDPEGQWRQFLALHPGLTPS